MKIYSFSASWCEPCTLYKPILAEVFGDFPEIEVESVDIDENLDLAFRFKIMSVPTLVIQVENRFQDTLVGLHGADEVRLFIKNAEIMGSLPIQVP